MTGKKSGKAIVVGAGFAGLASAIRLTSKGYEVKVIERCEDPGGRARCFSYEGGFEYDAGPTVITAPYLFSELFELLGEDINDHCEIRPLEKIWYQYRFTGDERIVNYGASDFFEEEIRKHFPKDIDGYQNLRRHGESLFDIGYEGMADMPFHAIHHAMKALPPIIRLKGWRSMMSMVRQYIQDPLLQQILTTPTLLLGGNPNTASSIYFLIHILEQKYGVHAVMGGTTALVHSLCELAERHGVRFHYGETVKEFDIEQNHKTIRKVITDHQSYETDLCVFNGDPSTLTTSLLSPRQRPFSHRLRAQKGQYTMGLLVIYFTTNKIYHEIEHHTIGFSQNYQQALKNIFAQGQNSEDISYYLHRPGATDPSINQKGEDRFYVLIPVPNQKNAAFESKAEIWRNYKDHCLKTLEQRILPELSQHLIHEDYISPEYFSDQLLSQHGAGFALQPSLIQSAFGRFPTQHPQLKNLLCVGAGVHPGAGLPGVVTSAKVMEKCL